MHPDDYHYCPRCATPLEQKFIFGAERPVCPACRWIYFADPKVAAAALIEENGAVLLVRRINEPGRGMWTLPAGFIDAGEDPALAAARECLEETGLQVKISGLLDIVSGREHSHGADFVIVYRAEVLGGELQAGDDADQVKWFSRTDLPPLAFRATRVVLQAL